MAMRGRGGGLSGIRAPAGRPVFRRPVFEDFRPFSEWKRVQEADILLIHLPGFMKENLKITSEPSNMIKVRGERMLANNTWSRFSQDFRIPEYCSASGISARFEGGILYITMPIDPSLTAPQTATNLETQSPKTTTTEPRMSPEEENNQFGKDSAQVQADIKTTSHPLSPKSVFANTDPSRFTQKEKAPKTGEMEARAEKSEESDKVATRPMTMPEGRAENRTTFKQKTTNLVEDVKSKLQKSIEDIKTGVAKSSAQKLEQDQTSPQKRDEYHGTSAETISNEKESKKKTNADSTNLSESLKEHFKIPHKENNKTNNSQEEKDVKEDVTQTAKKEEDQLEKYQKIVRDFGMKVKDERDTVVNIGVGVLVLVSLGVYISYTAFGNGAN